MKTYLRRVAKYLILILIVLFFLIILKYSGSGLSPMNMINQMFNEMQVFFIILFIYSFIYPILVFGKKERHLNGDFNTNREAIVQILEENHFVKAEETTEKITFRKKWILSRIATMGEDAIEIEIKDNPIYFSGYRKDLKRIDMGLDRKLLKY